MDVSIRQTIHGVAAPMHIRPDPATPKITLVAVAVLLALALLGFLTAAGV